MIFGMVPISKSLALLTMVFALLGGVACGGSAEAPAAEQKKAAPPAAVETKAEE